jgi:hypothetical protein
VDVGGANVDGLTLVVGPGINLRGRVWISPGAQMDFSRLNVSLQPLENYMGGAATQVAADGTFKLENLSDGTYRVNVAGFPEEFYLQSARLGGADVLGPGLTTSHNGNLGSLEIVLSKDGGEVDGVVLREAQPAGGALVVLVPNPPLRDRDDLYSVKAADALGRFSMLGLPPGDFKLFAWEQHEGVAYNDPDFIKEVEDRGTAVHVEEKQQQSVQLQAIPADNGEP